MITLKLGQIVQSTNALKELIATKLPIKISYQLNRLSREIDAELKIFEEKRIELIKEFGVKDEESGETKVSPENIAEFMKKFDELSAIEVNLNYADKIKVEDLGDIKMEASNIIDWLFE